MNRPALDRLFDHLDPPLWVVTAADGTRRGGLVATFVAQASIVPEMPRVLVGLSRGHHTWGLVEASDAFALHLLDEAHVGWVWHFGLRTGRGDVDKLRDVDHRPGATGAPILAGAPGWLECRVESRMDTGDRTIYLAAVVAGGLAQETPPLRVRHMLQLAGASERARLAEHLARDIDLDAAAIAAWRAARP